MTDIPESVRFLHEVEIGLGAWAWGDRLVWGYGKGYADTDIEEAFRVSVEHGVTLIDTAEVYGNGRSERLLGQFIQKLKQPVIVATKFFPMPWRIRRASVTRALRHSLERLQLERVDLYQIHWPSPLVPIEQYVEGMVSAHRLGLTRAIGVSNYDKNQMQRAITTLARYGLPLASNQVEYHLLNRRVEKNGLLERCQELGVRLIAYSPLAMGLLTGKYGPQNPPPGMRSGRYAAILKDIQPLLRLMTEIGQDLGGKSPAQIALNWIICKGALPIPGAKNARQAETNAGAAGWRLTPEQVRALDQASDPFTK
ncbi:MAG: aldo/keto reductase [Anaerolineales bacterium]|nr:aldo/keto reductase [Anaerolineales bacterium]MCX7755493.1 aldo/keto reductase [Anaerolineales bacterium]MDW8278257.1 aldo/keto reductase [Anaerolineales bacterium]